MSGVRAHLSGGGGRTRGWTWSKRSGWGVAKQRIVERRGAMRGADKSKSERRRQRQRGRGRSGVPVASGDKAPEEDLRGRAQRLSEISARGGRWPQLSQWHAPCAPRGVGRGDGGDLGELERASSPGLRLLSSRKFRRGGLESEKIDGGAGAARAQIVMPAMARTPGRYVSPSSATADLQSEHTCPFRSRPLR